MILIMIGLLLLYRIMLMSGLKAVWFLIILLVFPLLVLGFLLTNLSIFGEIVGGVMLMVSALILALRAVGFFFGSWASSVCSES